MDKTNGVMSMSVDSCSTSSGCVSDLDNLSSEDPSPDSPMSSSSGIQSLTADSSPTSESKDMIDDILIGKVEEVADDELVEEELIESEIVIDFTPNETSIPTITENCYSTEIYKNEKIDCFHDIHSSFDCSSSISDIYKSETASIKSDSTGSCVESDHKSCNGSTNGCSRLDQVFCKEETSNSFSSNSNNNYVCKWTHCDWPGNYDDLVDHIREIHVELQPYQQQKHNWIEVKSKLNHKSIDKRINDNNNNKNNAQQYVCLWKGCKVYGKASLSRNWLERHVLEQHSGPRPFKCIVECCGARFKVQSALERHVNSHFKPNVDFSNCLESPSTSANYQSMPSNCSSSDTQLNNCLTNGLSPFELHLQQTSRATMMRCKSLDSNLMNNCNANRNYCHNYGSHSFQLSHSNNGTPNKILKRKKSATKIRRKTIIVAKCSEDYFDECVMEQVRYGLIQLNERTGLDISGTHSSITFHSKVIARRENDGKVNLLLKWEPNDILPDVWVPEEDATELSVRSVPVSLIPQECLAKLIETNGFDSKPKIKQRRK